MRPEWVVSHLAVLQSIVAKQEKIKRRDSQAVNRKLNDLPEGIEQRQSETCAPDREARC
jgi:hypothetical protein